MADIWPDDEEPTGRARGLAVRQLQAFVEAFDALGTPVERDRALSHFLTWCACDADGRALLSALGSRLAPHG